MCCEVSWAGEIHFAGLIFTQCSLVSATSLDGSTTTRQLQVCSFSFSLFLRLYVSICLSVLLSRYLPLCPSNVSPAKSFTSPWLKIIRWILIRFSISTFNHSRRVHESITRSCQSMLLQPWQWTCYRYCPSWFNQDFWYIVHIYLVRKTAVFLVSM